MSIRRNVIANVIGKIWSGLMSFAFVPFYIRFMGIEAYGLIGFFVSMLAIFFMLDMGLSTTINRELAKISARGELATSGRDLVRTLELVYWGTGIAIGVLIVLLAPWLAGYWLNTKGLTQSEATETIRLMGLVAAFRWPVTLYAGALMGLQRQVFLNVATSIFATLQGFVAVAILWLISPTIQAFFWWQIAVAAAQVIFMSTQLWRLLPTEENRPSFVPAMLRSVIVFSAGVTGITVLSVALTQADKLVLSRILTLDMFGYYSLASSLAGTINIAAIAVYGALFPVFSQLVENNKKYELSEIYHKSCQLLSLLIFPIGFAVILFTRELLNFYIRDALVVEQTYLLLKLLIAGNMILSLMLLPLALQFAHGWTKLSLYKNVVAVICFLPLLWLFISTCGSTGAAVAWILLTIGYFLVEIPLMHQHILKDEHWKWYFLDVGVPAAVSIGVIGVARLLIPFDAPLIVSIPAITVAALVALSTTIVAMPSTRAWPARVFAWSIGR